MCSDGCLCLSDVRMTTAVLWNLDFRDVWQPVLRWRALRKAHFADEVAAAGATPEHHECCSFISRNVQDVAQCSVEPKIPPLEINWRITQCPPEPRTQAPKSCVITRLPERGRCVPSFTTRTLALRSGVGPECAGCNQHQLML